MGVQQFIKNGMYRGVHAIEATKIRVIGSKRLYFGCKPV